MADYKKSQVLETVEKTALVPVFYNPDLDTSKNVLKACYEGGIRTFEFTNRGEKAAEVFAGLVAYARQFPGMILGVGSISFARDARRFIKLGANFVVGPQYFPVAGSSLPGTGTFFTTKPDRRMMTTPSPPLPAVSDVAPSYEAPPPPPEPVPSLPFVAAGLAPSVPPAPSPPMPEPPLPITEPFRVPPPPPAA